MWLRESTFSPNVDEKDFDAGDNVHFKDYVGDGVNVGIDTIFELMMMMMTDDDDGADDDDNDD